MVNPLYTCGPIWICRLDPSARTLLFAASLGNGSTTPYAATVAVSPRTQMEPHCRSPHRWKTQGSDGFVAVFDHSGSLLWSTYLGGKVDDSIDWILPCADGSAAVVGTTNSSDFPWSAPSSPVGQGNTLIAHLRP